MELITYFQTNKNNNVETYFETKRFYFFKFFQLQKSLIYENIPLLDYLVGIQVMKIVVM